MNQLEDCLEFLKPTRTLIHLDIACRPFTLSYCERPKEALGSSLLDQKYVFRLVLVVQQDHTPACLGELEVTNKKETVFLYEPIILRVDIWLI